MRNSFSKALSSSLSSLFLSYTHSVCVCVCVLLCVICCFSFFNFSCLFLCINFIFLEHTVFTTLQIHKKMALDNSQALLLTAIRRYKHTCTPVHNCVYMCTRTHAYTPVNSFYPVLSQSIQV